LVSLALRQRDIARLYPANIRTPTARPMVARKSRKSGGDTAAAIIPGTPPPKNRGAKKLLSCAMTTAPVAKNSALSISRGQPARAATQYPTRHRDGPGKCCHAYDQQNVDDRGSHDIAQCNIRHTAQRGDISHQTLGRRRADTLPPSGQSRAAISPTPGGPDAAPHQRITTQKKADQSGEDIKVIQ
jgi:hypothetical protein